MDQVPHHQIPKVRLTRCEDVPGPEVLYLLDQVNVVLQAEPRYLHIDNLRLEEERNTQLQSGRINQTFRVDMSSLMWCVVKFASSWWMPGLR